MKIGKKWLVLGAILATLPAAALEPATKPPVLIGLSAEFGLANSTSAQAIEQGIRLATEEINAKGGVLGGRPLRLETRDDRSVPARGIENLKELAALPDLVAVFCGRFSPVAMEMSPVAHDLGIPLLDPWAAADSITKPDRAPNFAFRLSLKDSQAMPAMIRHAEKRGYKRIGMLLPNTGWGRSNDKAAEAYFAGQAKAQLVKTRWYNWGDASMAPLYEDLVQAGAQAILFVANDREGSILLNEVAGLPTERWRPILSHWGVTGGRFFEAARDALAKLDFTVVQTFSFFRADPAVLGPLMKTARAVYGIDKVEAFDSPVGVGHAYDLTHLLARAIDKAGGTDRSAIRAAFENLGPYRGLVRNFETSPFTPANHDALGQESVFMARYRADGAIVPVEE